MGIIEITKNNNNFNETIEFKVLLPVCPSCSTKNRTGLKPLKIKIITFFKCLLSVLSDAICKNICLNDNNKSLN